MQNSIISEVYKDDHIKLVVNSRIIELEVAKRGWKQAYNEWDERNMNTGPLSIFVYKPEI